jgi:hypothetical protein
MPRTTVRHIASCTDIILRKALGIVARARSPSAQLRRCARPTSVPSRMSPHRVLEDGSLAAQHTHALFRIYLYPHRNTHTDYTTSRKRKVFVPSSECPLHAHSHARPPLLHLGAPLGPHARLACCAIPQGCCLTSGTHLPSVRLVVRPEPDESCSCDPCVSGMRCLGTPINSVQ